MRPVMVRAEIDVNSAGLMLWSYSVNATFLPEDWERVHYKKLSSDALFESRAQANQHAILHLLALVKLLGARMLKRPAFYEDRLYQLTVAYPHAAGAPTLLRVIARNGFPPLGRLVPLPDGFTDLHSLTEREIGTAIADALSQR